MTTLKIQREEFLGTGAVKIGLATTLVYVEALVNTKQKIARSRRVTKAKKPTKNDNKHPMGMFLIPDEEIDDTIQDVLAMEAFCRDFRAALERRMMFDDEFKTAYAEQVPTRPHTSWKDPDKALTLMGKAKILPEDTYAPRKIMPPIAWTKEEAVAEALAKQKVPKKIKAIHDLMQTKSNGFNFVLKPRKPE